MIPAWKSVLSPWCRAAAVHVRGMSGCYIAALMFLSACGSNGGPSDAIVEGECEILSSGDADGGAGASDLDSLQHIGCKADFQALASLPLDVTLPGARSVKVVLDQDNGDALYFQNSVKYEIHYEFASAKLPNVGDLGTFNATEYFSPLRRFILGAVTYYEQPDVWALELAPYDTASATMIQRIYEKVKAAAFFGPALVFHPTSENVAATAAKLPSGVKMKTTDEIYAATDYQPLTLATGIGRLRFVPTATIETANLSYQDIVVLDYAPNEITVVRGVITEQFQTPLSHLNVLAGNRHTPNMGLRGAMSHPTLKKYEGKLVELKVESSQWSIREVTEAEAQAYWDANKPTPKVLPPMNLEVTGLWDIADVTPDPTDGSSLRDAIRKAVLAFGGKSAQFSLLARMKDVPTTKAFAIPVYYYDQFMRQNGYYERIDALLADSQFKTDAATRALKLAELRELMKTGTVDAEFQTLLRNKLAADYPGKAIRFRSSTNSEDLDGFPCAGCYESHSGDQADWNDILDALRETWSGVWLFAGFEERNYYGVDQKSIAMGILVHRSFPGEEANGVAVTANPFNANGLDPAYYINVQYGGWAEVVSPPAGVTSDQFLYYFAQPNQPMVFITHSSLVAEGTTVLTSEQALQLGKALKAIHERFSAAYGPAAGNTGWYAMDVEFKYDNDDAPELPASLYIKQARPYPGRGQ